MATWNDAKEHLRGMLQIKEIDVNNLVTELSFSDGRTQLVYVMHLLDYKGNDVITFYSPFALVSSQSAHAVMNNTMVKNSPFGIALVGDYWVVKHFAFTATLDELELIEPIKLMAEVADSIEESFGGPDRF